MNCTKILDTVYEYAGGEPMPLSVKLWVGLHLLVCPGCAQEVERFEVTRDILRSEFLPPAPGLEDSVMARIAAGQEEPAAFDGEEIPAHAIEIPGPVSTRGWVIVGLITMTSLVTTFFGMDFGKVAHNAGVSFLLPVGITVGIVLTSYGALFIGSHLKELSERFGL
ncbi:MAG: peptidoglycan-binding protein [Treponema sp.]|nr:peptidoglycan-binding protein [Treponema sp.]